MSEVNGKAIRDRSIDRRSTVSGDTHRTKRSHRSRSRDKDHDRERDRRRHDNRRSSRDRYRDRDVERERDSDRGYRERSHRSRDESERDRHRYRDRDRHGDHDSLRHREYKDRDERDRRERRRPRDDEMVDDDYRRDRVKRRRDEGRPRDDRSPIRGSDYSRDPLPRSNRPHSPNRRDGGPPRPKERSVRDDDPNQQEHSPPLEDSVDRPAREELSSSLEKRPSPSYEPPSAILGDGEPDHQEDDSEARSVFVSQLAARLTARDLGYFFEDKLGEGSVRDCRIVTDRISRRSKGIAYVEFRSIDLVPRAIALSGTIVMGLPIMIQLTEAERNRTHAADLAASGGHSSTRGAMQLYVGSLHFNLTESDIRQVFEPFGELDFVDLHRDPLTGRSKGYAFVQYKRPDDAKMALEQMEGFELAGRALRVNTVHEKGSAAKIQQDSLEENGGANLNAASRQALMQKLARTENEPTKQLEIARPNIPQAMTTRCVLMKNMFNPEEETEPNWDKELAEEVTRECENSYGKVVTIKVERESEGEIYIKFGSVDVASAAVTALNGRFFGGRQITAGFISDAIMQAHQ